MAADIFASVSRETRYFSSHAMTPANPHIWGILAGRSDFVWATPQRRASSVEAMPAPRLFCSGDACVAIDAQRQRLCAEAGEFESITAAGVLRLRSNRDAGVATTAEARSVISVRVV